MGCADYQLFVSRLLDDELDKDNEPALSSHLAMCNECRAFLTTANRIRLDLSRDVPQRLSETVDKRVLAQLGQRQPGQALMTKHWTSAGQRLSEWAWGKSISIPLPVAASLLALLLSGLLLVSIDAASSESAVGAPPRMVQTP